MAIGAIHSGLRLGSSIRWATCSIQLVWSPLPREGGTPQPWRMALRAGPTKKFINLIINKFIKMRKKGSYDVFHFSNC